MYQLLSRKMEVQPRGDGGGGHFLIKGKKRLKNKVSRLKSYYCNTKMLIRWGPQLATEQTVMGQGSHRPVAHIQQKIKQSTSSFGCLVTQEENHIVLVVNLIATKRLIFFLQKRVNFFCFKLYELCKEDVPSSQRSSLLTTRPTNQQPERIKTIKDRCV